MKRHFVFPIIILLFCMASCRKHEVNFDEMSTKPTVKIQNQTLILTGGAHRLASAHYVSPRARIEKDRIYVYGKMTTNRNAITNQISLRGQMKQVDWKVFWVNKDGTLIEMQIEN
ncbi:MAG: hypothetical protein ACYTBV_04780 [Planctomycetota bacterium]|jgi:hypothetical protein